MSVGDWAKSVAWVVRALVILAALAAVGAIIPLCVGVVLQVVLGQRRIPGYVPWAAAIAVAVLLAFSTHPPFEVGATLLGITAAGFGVFMDAGVHTVLSYRQGLHGDLAPPSLGEA